MRASLPDTVALIISGYADVEGIAPDVPRLTKPVRGSDLARMLEELTGAHASSQATLC